LVVSSILIGWQNPTQKEATRDVNAATFAKSDNYYYKRA
jgi:hypothetical protein